MGKGNSGENFSHKAAYVFSNGRGRRKAGRFDADELDNLRKFRIPLNDEVRDALFSVLGWWRELGANAGVRRNQVGRLDFRKQKFRAACELLD